MVSSAATTVGAYLASLPPDRRAAVETVREVVNRNLPAGFVEGMQYGMIGWAVPLARFPGTYNGQPLGVAALAAQKGYLSLYLMAVHGGEHEAWFLQEYARSGKRLDMGQSCVRFKTADDLPLELIGQAIARISPEQLIARHEAAHGKGAAAARTKARASKGPSTGSGRTESGAKAAKPKASKGPSTGSGRTESGAKAAKAKVSAPARRR